MKGPLALTLLLLVASFGMACATPRLVALAEHYAGGFGLDPDLLVAVVWTERHVCPDAVSPKDAIGLGQFMPGTGTGLGIDPRAAHHNLWGTTKVLRDSYHEFHSWPLALAAFNAGSGPVRRYQGIPPFQETHNDVRQVLAVYKCLKEPRDAAGS